jgi:catechol 2,3-dioxygenase-like lactoylglutathione lyase family enzyme
MAASNRDDDFGDPVAHQHRGVRQGTWLLLVSGGGPTADKPRVTFRPPADPDQVSHAMTLRVADCRATYAALTARGATFLTPPHDWGGEIRCFLGDPDGHLVEISESVGT